MDWRRPLATNRLAGNDLHVWQIRLDQPEDVFRQLHALLSRDEQARAARYYFDQDRKRHAVARGALRCILSSYAGARPDQLIFEYGAQGKPALVNTPVEFNLAHAGEMALCAVALQPVGVDVEDMRRPIDDMDDVAQRFFAKREWEQFNALPAYERHAAFFRCWTRKEAFIKAIGDGLSHPLDRFVVSFNASEPPALESIDGDANAAREWSLLNIELGTDYAGAVVVHAPACRLMCWSWQMTDA